MFNYLNIEIPIIKDLELFSDFRTLGLKILLPLFLIFLISGYIGLERQNVVKPQA